MTEVTCPACGAAASGRFCASCGASLPGRVTCPECGSEIPGGGRFCNQCGAAARAAATPEAPAAPSPPATPSSGPAHRKRPAGEARAASTLPWTIAALAILALVIALVFPRPGSNPTAPAPAAAPAAGGQPFGDASGVDISAMTPLERANSLFNRVMQNVSAGDSAQVEFFLPMALAAYADVPLLDADGHYHVAVLHLADGNPAAARQNADSILATADTHLFGLFTAAQAEAALGNSIDADAFYQRFLDAYDAESTLSRQEYTEHAAVMPLMLEEARQAVGNGP